MPTQVSKPRIKRLHDNLRMWVGWWICTTEGVVGIGETPANAYYDWFARSGLRLKHGL